MSSEKKVSDLFSLLSQFYHPALYQVLQLWRSRPSCQGMQAATPAQEVPLLPKHQPYGGLMSIEGPAGPQLSGKASLLSG